MNLRQFIGLPFKPFGRDWDGVDCWGLVYLWHRECNSEQLPVYAFQPDTTAASAAIANATSIEPCWVKVDQVKLGDVAVFDLFGRPAHVGLVLDAERMLHIEKGIDSSIETITAPRWLKRLRGIYRYVF